MSCSTHSHTRTPPPFPSLPKAFVDLIVPLEALGRLHYTDVFDMKNTEDELEGKSGPRQSSTASNAISKASIEMISCVGGSGFGVPQIAMDEHAEVRPSTSANRLIFSALPLAIFLVVTQGILALAALEK